MRTILVLVSCLMLMASPLLAADTIKLGAFFDLSGRAAFIGTPTKLVAEMVTGETPHIDPLPYRIGRFL